MAEGNLVLLILSAAIAYIVGAIPFSYIFSKTLKGEDIRKSGSGNAGTANALRTYGWGIGILTLVFDVLKGVLAAFIGMWIAGSEGLYVAAVFAVVGHNFPVFLKFKGGKGIAATTGVLLVIQPLATVIIFSICVIIVVKTKMMSVGSIIGLVASAVAAVFLSGGNAWWWVAVLIIALMGLLTHRENIKRLSRGEENKLNLSKK